MGMEKVGVQVLVLDALFSQHFEYRSSYSRATFSIQKLIVY